MTGSRKECRGGRPCHAATFEEAVDCQLHHSDLTLSEIAELLGYNRNALGKMACATDTRPFRRR